MTRCHFYLSGNDLMVEWLSGDKKCHRFEYPQPQNRSPRSVVQILILFTKNIYVYVIEHVTHANFYITNWYSSYLFPF